MPFELNLKKEHQNDQNNSEILESQSTVQNIDKNIDDATEFNKEAAKKVITTKDVDQVSR